ncbi:MAG: minor capsid protein [Acutalibacteraceae bacterium]|nr:MAG TPA: hypothetical protein [Caudoviricetes sp.]
MLADIRDWIKTLFQADFYYVGKLDAKKEKSIGVYQLKRMIPPNVAYSRLETYERKGVTLLVHWNKNATETETAAFMLYEKLRAVDSLRLNETRVLYLELLKSEPVNIGSDENGVHECVIDLILYYEKEK